MSTRSSDIGGGAGTTNRSTSTDSAATTGAGEGTSTETRSSMADEPMGAFRSDAGAASSTSAEGSGSMVQNAAPSDAPATAPQSGTPAFAKPGEGILSVAGNTQAVAAPVADTLYPLRVTVDGHIHQGKEIKKGQTIALDAPEYRFMITNQLGEPGNKEDVGLDVDVQGNAIKPTAPTPVPLPEDQAIKPDELSSSGILRRVEEAAQASTESGKQ